MNTNTYEDALQDANDYLKEISTNDSCLKMFVEIEKMLEENELLLLRKLESISTDRYMVTQLFIAKNAMKEIRNIGESPQLTSPDAKSFFEDMDILKILSNFNIILKKNIDPNFNYLNLDMVEINKLPLSEKFAKEIVNKTKYLITKYYYEETIKQSDELFNKLIHSRCPYQMNTNNNLIPEINNNIASSKEKNDDLLDKTQVLEKLKISNSTLHRMRKSNEIKYIEIGKKKFLYQKEEIERLLIGVKKHIKYREAS
ncbi:MAG: helix-turn-helix domain-containing protein [Bacteroidota bacterium]